MNDRFINEVTCGDSEQLIQDLDNDSIDLVVTSPPYNVDLGYNAHHKSPYDPVSYTHLTLPTILLV